MSSNAAQSGLDFVHRIMQDIQAVQESVQAVQQQVDREKVERSADLASLADVLDRKVLGVQKDHAQLVERVEDQNLETKRSFAAVADEQGGLQMRQAAMLETILGHADRLGHLEGRATSLERDLSTKANAAELRTLTVRLADLESEVAGKAPLADHRSAVNKLADLESMVADRLVQAERQLQALQQHLELSMSEVERRALAADHKALDARVRAAEGALEQQRADLQTKASHAEQQEADRSLAAVAGELEKVKAYVRQEEDATRQSLHRLGRELSAMAPKAEVDTLGHGVQDLDRAFRQAQTQLGELNQELLAKAARLDVESVVARLAGLEGVAGALERSLDRKADLDQHLSPVRTKLESLELATASKAETMDLKGALTLLDEETKRQRALTLRTEETECALGLTASQRELEATCARLSQVQQELAKKAERQDLETTGASIWSSLSALEQSVGPLERRLAGGEERSDNTWRRLEGRMEDLEHRKADVDHLQQVMVRLEEKADANHIHDRIVSQDGRTTFAI